MTEVYRNLTRRAWSVREGGRVVAHLPELALRDVRLVVRPGGRAAVLRTGQRSVHAWARGTRTELPAIPPGAVEIGYSPFEAEFFTSRPGFSKVLACRIIVFTDSGTAFALL
ncbi:hypothetical protein [Methylobacterium frigidaeris]|uniref:Uncharacterized protein n=1 Tax=Methylobacterium frigidaeris TaxID=2038277 RepID=A0AA37HJW0_9HYPH|nr:hypothetical protein [Methylobacterium frigidaeris]PIK72684.1 hypothetical protein CS379_12625 [Methylobacterium frigidaeris]GJD66480.1 hypothetical protein MPEAHAMD_6678 [Methylobacterium frigidaeris]